MLLCVGFGDVTGNYFKFTADTEGLGKSAVEGPMKEFTMWIMSVLGTDYLYNISPSACHKHTVAFIFDFQKTVIRPKTGPQAGPHFGCSVCSKKSKKDVISDLKFQGRLKVYLQKNKKG